MGGWENADGRQRRGDASGRLALGYHQLTCGGGVSPVEAELDAVAHRPREHEEEEARRSAAADDARLGEWPPRKPAEAGAGAARPHARRRQRFSGTTGAALAVLICFQARSFSSFYLQQTKQTSPAGRACYCFVAVPRRMGKAKPPASAGGPPRSASWLSSRQRKKCWRLSVFVLLPITLAFLVAFLAAPEQPPLSSAGEG